MLRYAFRIHVHLSRPSFGVTSSQNEPFSEESARAHSMVHLFHSKEDTLSVFCLLDLPYQDSSLQIQFCAFNPRMGHDMTLSIAIRLPLEEGKPTAKLQNYCTHQTHSFKIFGDSQSVWLKESADIQRTFSWESFSQTRNLFGLRQSAEQRKGAFFITHWMFHRISKGNMHALKFSISWAFWWDFQAILFRSVHLMFYRLW